MSWRVIAGSDGEPTRLIENGIAVFTPVDPSVFMKSYIQTLKDDPVCTKCQAVLGCGIELLVTKTTGAAGLAVHKIHCPECLASTVKVTQPGRQPLFFAR